MYMSDDVTLIANNIEVTTFYSQTGCELFNYNSYSPNNNEHSITNLNLTDIRSQGAIIKINNGIISLVDSKIENFHKCYLENNCENTLDSDMNATKTDLFLLYDHSTINVNNTIFDNVNGNIGIQSYIGSKVYFFNDIIKNSYFRNGLFNINDSTSGELNINQCQFINITSESGSIIYNNNYYIANINILFKNSIFMNNIAKKYGGVAYLISPRITPCLKFDQCQFLNNKATRGSIVYSLNMNSEPQISNSEELKKIDGAFATNPTKIRLDENTLTSNITIYSGEKIPEGISCKIYDDYDNLINFEDDISDMNLNDIVFFTVEVNDTYNTEIYGQTQNYCWKDSCILPPIAVTGNPGNYLLNFKINTFGKFSSFRYDFPGIPIEIKQCNKSYINQNTYSSTFKSCYKPKCVPVCKNKGLCVNNNVCNCTGTMYTGLYCDEHFKLEKIKELDIIVRFISLILLICCFVIMFYTIKYRNSPIIKGRSIEFLIIILIGSIINIIYINLLIKERTKSSFALVFGSIFVKTLRVYGIYTSRITRKEKRMEISNNIMYTIVVSFIIFHILIALIWLMFDEVQNLIILVYIYCIVKLITDFVNNEKDIIINIKDLFNEFGAIINTSIVLYFIFIAKFNSVNINKYLDTELKRTSKYQKCDDTFNSTINSTINSTPS
ncbi:hypothetical protein BCR32DRAFT_240335 [Anaeromyces robustus]|uniref:G-protein coupled receptors family 3 profile domain-containing protein n=1 Tax=Anaeromyces robustus TaxID=1754192 RepID=A0A1Y1XNU8_9FUNG|nr:hypothetical protein BCR32DRAFT_240335 [Anaeromyces robustus]|eukprot:ORX87196.1 hypothetical protein BCR32DRAFT_240335 [Anaeromyces robustus]